MVRKEQTFLIIILQEVKNFAALLEPSIVVGVDSRLISEREKLDSLVKIERATRTYIDVDKVYRQAKIYGCDANKRKARAKLTKLMTEVQNSKHLAVEVSVPLESKRLVFLMFLISGGYEMPHYHSTILQLD